MAQLSLMGYPAHSWSQPPSASWPCMSPYSWLLTCACDCQASLYRRAVALGILREKGEKLFLSMLFYSLEGDSAGRYREPVSQTRRLPLPEAAGALFPPPSSPENASQLPPPVTVTCPIPRVWAQGAASSEGGLQRAPRSEGCAHVWAMTRPRSSQGRTRGRGQ